ncbi:uncharacterized protein [Rutidosis leptorrhynchoides]|uniref:uncharacterized protein isoform X2 n=1 Tax=Rutidosis leptorrhynchoides TaxID=125765 RepID=UPI003A999A5A
METVVAVEENDKSKVESASAIVITCSDSSKQISDPVVYKLARVVGDGIYIPATDDEVMKVEDLIDHDHNSPLQCVLDDSQTAVCISNDDTFCQEFVPIDCEGLLDFEDPSNVGERSDAFEDPSIVGGRSDAFEDPSIVGGRSDAFEDPSNAFEDPSNAFEDPSNVFKDPSNAFKDPPNAFEDPSIVGGRSDAVVDITVDPGKGDHKDEEVTQSESVPADVKIDQSGDRKQPDLPMVAAESEPSTSTMGAGSKPDFSKLKGEICLDNLSVRELHATFKATFGRETSVKDKQWLKRRISMGLSNSCDVSATTFIIENNEVKKKGECNSKDENLNEVTVTGLEGRNNSSDNNDNNISVGQTIQMKDDFSVQSATSKHHIALEDDIHGSKRVRKPTKRYIEVSESDTRECSGRPVSSVRSSGYGTRNRVRPINNIQPVRRPLVTRQDSIGGSGVEIPYVSRIRRGRPRENFMSLMKFQSCGMGNTTKPVNKALDGQDPQSDEEIENRELKTTSTTGWVQQPIKIIKEAGETEQYSEQSADLNNDSDEGLADSYADESDDNILTVPTAKGGMRRKHHRPWTLSEVVKLVEGVSRYGAGRWSEIKRISFATCSHRTSVDLKDKWRNLLRASFTQLPADKGVQNSKKHASVPIPAPILLRVRELAEMQPQVSPDLRSVKFGGHSNNSSRNVNDIRSGFL